MRDPAVLQGVLGLGVLAQLVARARFRARQTGAPDWHSLHDRLATMADLAAHRPVLAALGVSDFGALMRRARDHWPSVEEHVDGVSEAILRPVCIAAIVLEEAVDDVRRRPAPAAEVPHG